MEPIKYNDNVTIIQTEDVASGSLKNNDEFFALMVTDNCTQVNDSNRFYNCHKGWIGIERPTNKGIYICKSINYPRGSVGIMGGSRGIPIIVKIKDESKCVRLTNKE